jgi:putative spermidine/putrescine transport system permease protein
MDEQQVKPARFFTGVTLLAAANLAIVVFLFLPLIVVILSSLSATSFVTFPPKGFSLNAYRDLGSHREFVDSAILSGKIAVVVAILTPAVALLASLGLRSLGLRSVLARRLESAFLAPLSVPHVVLGIALLQCFRLIGWDPSLLTLILGHLIITLPYGIRIISASLRGLDPNMERAAAVLGASPWQIFWRVALPQVRPAIVASVFLAAVVSFDDVGVALFLTNAQTVTLPVRIFSYIEYQYAPFIAALGALLALIPIAGAVLMERTFGLARLFGIPIESQQQP